MSNFMAQELLFDYVTDQLDSERQKSVREFVLGSPEAQADIQKIKAGLAYVDRLSQTLIADSVLTQVKAPTTYFQLVHQKMRIEHWSTGIKMGLEVLLVAVFIISISLLIPWHKMMEINWSISRDVILAEVEKKQAHSIDGDGQGEILPSDGSVSKTTDGAEVYPDEAVGKIKPVPNKTAAAHLAETVTPNVTGNSVVQSQAPLVPPTETVSIPVQESKAQANANAPTSSSSTKDTGAGAEHKGFLFRGSIVVTNVPTVTAKFVEKIQELGGRKAGEVELGWKKGDSSYFHMTIPESKYSAFIEFAKDYGVFKVSKEKHERVMPEGIVRVIFTIDEKKSK